MNLWILLIDLILIWVLKHALEAAPDFSLHFSLRFVVLLSFILLLFSLNCFPPSFLCFCFLMELLPSSSHDLSFVTMITVFFTADFFFLSIFSDWLLAAIIRYLNRPVRRNSGVQWV